MWSMARAGTLDMARACKFYCLIPLCPRIAVLHDMLVLWPVVARDCVCFYLLGCLFLFWCWCVFSCSVLQLLSEGSVTNTFHIPIVVSAGHILGRYAFKLACQTYGSYVSPGCSGLPLSRLLLNARQPGQPSTLPASNPRTAVQHVLVLR